MKYKIIFINFILAIIPLFVWIYSWSCGDDSLNSSFKQLSCFYEYIVKNKMFLLKEFFPHYILSLAVLFALTLLLYFMYIKILKRNKEKTLYILAILALFFGASSLTFVFIIFIIISSKILKQVYEVEGKINNERLYTLVIILTLVLVTLDFINGLLFISALFLSFFIFVIYYKVHNILRSDKKNIYSEIKQKTAILLPLIIILSASINFLAQHELDSFIKNRTIENVRIIERKVYTNVNAQGDFLIIKNRENYEKFESEHSLKLPLVDFNSEVLLISYGKRVKRVFYVAGEVNEELVRFLFFNEEINAIEAVVVETYFKKWIKVEDDFLRYKISPHDSLYNDRYILTAG